MSFCSICKYRCLLHERIPAALEKMDIGKMTTSAQLLATRGTDVFQVEIFSENAIRDEAAGKKLSDKNVRIGLLVGNRRIEIVGDAGVETAKVYEHKRIQKEMCRILSELEPHLRRGSEAMQDAKGDVSALVACYGQEVSVLTCRSISPLRFQHFPIISLLQQIAHR